MRDPKRIGPMLRGLRVLWERNPDWRLSQLICNLARYEGWDNPDVFYFEDDRLDAAIQKALQS